MRTGLFTKVVVCLTLFFSAFGGQKAYADHISSIDMFVDYIGSGPTNMKYRITLRFYKICGVGYGGIGTQPDLPLSDYVTVKSASLGFNKQVNVKSIVLFNNANNVPVYEDTVDNLCPGFSKVNSCRVLANVNYSGYTTRTYVDTVTVPGRSSDLTFSWSSCCRLILYQNITSAGPSFYLEAGINNLLKYNASTPRYQGQPFTFCCTNQPSLLSNLPSDPDGDSLNTFNTACRQSATLAAVYAAGYDSTQPTGTSAPAYYKVSPISGKASFLAQNSGKYALAFRTEALDRATKQRISYVSRDITITVLPCTNVPPTIDSLPQGLTGVKKIDTAGGDVVLTACPQLPLHFKINAHSNNPNGLIYMRPAGPLPLGMTVVPSVAGGTGFVDISWTPSASQLGPYTISILAVDSTCAVGQEITLRNEFTFTVNVLPGLDAGPDLLVCPLGERPVKLGTNVSPGSTLTWTNLSGATAEYLTCTDCLNPLASPPRSYAYIATTTNPLYVCKSMDTVVVYIDTSVQVKALQEPLLVCRPSYIQLLSQATGPQPYSNLPCGTSGTLSCTQEDSVTVGFGTNGPSDIRNTPFFSGSRYHLYQFIIPKAELLAAGLYSGTLNSLSFQTLGAIVGTAPIEFVTVSLACVGYDKFITPANNGSFNYSGTTVASLGSYTLTPNAWNKISFSQPYNWDTSLNLLVSICTGPMTVPNPNGADVVAMAPGLTIQKYDLSINVCGGNAPAVQAYYERPIVKFNYCSTPVLPFSYHWVPGINLQDSNAQNPRAYVDASRNYAVYTVGRNGCLVRDSLHITVPIHHLAVGPQDTVVCVNQPVQLHATGGQSYTWYEIHEGAWSSASASLSCTNCSDPFAMPRVTTKYAVVFGNDVHATNPINTPVYEEGCPDTLTVKVNINQLPDVYSDNNDTMIKYGRSVQLFAHGAQRYTWTPVGSLNDPNSPAPVATPRETTTYIVSGMDSNGCVSKDTVRVSVDYRNNVLVPSAFTPNGDGHNDVFKLVGASFQRLMEFRIFNRWGQEVFATTDITKGWDGKWKGVDQEVGNYQYIIRIGYPDGETGLFKGDLTLVR